MEHNGRQLNQECLEWLGVDNGSSVTSPNVFLRLEGAFLARVGQFIHYLS